MKIAIYGAGYYGKYIYDEISNHKQTNISVVFWIDNHKEERSIYGLPVYTEKDFFLQQKEREIDAIIIGIEYADMAHKLTLSLLMRGYDKIYLACLESELSFSFVAKVPILDEKGNFTPCVKFYKEIKPKLEFMEVLVTKHCNLNCKSCGHFSNVVTDKSLMEVDEFESYLAQLHKKIREIVRFQLLGGEPLLHPQLAQFVLLTRKYFPGAHIDVVTNGLLIPQISKELADAMVLSNAHFFISQYQPTRERLAEIIKFLEERRINYYISQPLTHFESVLTFQEEDGEKAFKKRFKRDCICHSIEKGRIYICPTIERLYAVQDFFNIEISEEELRNASLDLMNDDVDGWDMLKYFNAPVSLCRFCCPERKESLWETGKPEIEDWLVKERGM